MGKTPNEKVEKMIESDKTTIRKSESGVEIRPTDKVDPAEFAPEPPPPPAPEPPPPPAPEPPPPPAPEPPPPPAPEPPPPTPQADK